jgi:hypothetical protein
MTMPTPSENEGHYGYVESNSLITLVSKLPLVRFPLTPIELSSPPRIAPGSSRSQHVLSILLFSICGIPFTLTVPIDTLASWFRLRLST